MPYDLDALAYTYGNTSFPNRLTAFTLSSGAPASATYQLVYDANQGNITQYQAPAGADDTYLNYDPDSAGHICHRDGCAASGDVKLRS